MAQYERDGGDGARIALAVFSPAIVAAGFFAFPFVPAISVYLDGRSRTYTAAASVLLGCAALPMLLGPHAYSLSAFIAVATAAAYILARVKVPFATGFVGSAGGGVLGAVILLGLLGAGFESPLNVVAASVLTDGLSNMASAGQPLFLNYLAGQVKWVEQGNPIDLFTQLSASGDIMRLIAGMPIADQAALIRPFMEQFCAAYLPALALVGGVFTGALGYYLPVLALDRRRRRLAPPQPEPAGEGAEGSAEAPVPPFAAFKVPRYIVITLLLLYIVSTYMFADSSPGFVALNAASSMLFNSLMIVQALAMLSFFMNRMKMPAAAQFVLLVLVFLLFSWCILPYVGIFDALFDMRAVTMRMDALRAKGKNAFTPEGLEELRRMEQRRKNGRDGRNGKDGGEGDAK